MGFRTSMGDALTGLRRNSSMAVSLIVTLTVSLMLAALGLLMQQQAERTEHFFGERLQLQVTMCTDNSPSEGCVTGAATDRQLAAVKEALAEHRLVADVEVRTPAENYEQAQAYLGQTETGRKQLATLGPADFFESYFVTLEDPQQFQGVVDEVGQMDGVANVNSLRDILGPLFEILDKIRWAALVTSLLLVVAAVLQVSNTIRMTAIVRAREIGIMRLVGASQWHIQWPFILEAIVAALVSAAVACVGLAAFMHFVVYGYLRDTLGQITTWVGWNEAFVVMGYTTVFALLLALIPTLFVTRRYLDV